MSAAWVLRQAITSFPSGSIHLIAVGYAKDHNTDLLIAHFDDQWFIAPNNGLLSLIHSGLGKDESPISYYRANVKESSKQSLAWQGPYIARTYLSELATHLYQDTPIKHVAEPTQEVVRFKWAESFADSNGIQGLVLHIDHFGNLITNISVESFTSVVGAHAFKLFAGNSIIRQIHTHPLQVEEQDVFAVLGASGMVEIGVKGGNASELLSIQKGAAVSVVIETSKKA